MPSNSYPMELIRTSLDHKGGTKSYQLIMVSAADGKTLVIRHWGPKGRLNAQAVDQFDDAEKARACYERYLKERGRKGYEVVISQPQIVNAPAELPLKIGRGLFPKLGPKAINHIDPNYQTDGMRDPQPNRFDEEGKYIGEPPVKKVDFEAELKKEREQALSSHPLWGRF